MLLGSVIAIVLTYSLLVAGAYRWFFGLSGRTELGILPVLVAVVMIAVLTNMPVTVNGIGLREQLHYLLFADLGMPKEVSVSISLLMFAHVLVLSLFGYALWTRRRLPRWRNPAD
jgi:uncharacterized membrane protein YbhN (UPF0104 family)